MRSESTQLRFIRLLLSLLVVTGPHLTHADFVRAQSASIVDFNASAVAQALVVSVSMPVFNLRLTL